MTNPNRSPNDDFTPQEAQERFEATLRGALKAPPQHKEAPKKAAPKKRGVYERNAPKKKPASP